MRQRKGCARELQRAKSSCQFAVAELKRQWTRIDGGLDKCGGDCGFLRGGVGRKRLRRITNETAGTSYQAVRGQKVSKEAK